MSKRAIAILIAAVVFALAAPALMLSRSQARLRRENTQLRQDAVQLPRVTADNQRLSNVLTQMRAAQVDARLQFQELVRLRAEVNRLETQQSNRLEQAYISQSRDLAALRDELLRLNQQNEELDALRQEVSQLRATAATASPDPTTESEATPVEEPSLSLVTIRTQGEPFAEKLKRAVGAADEESFRDVFGRFLQDNGVATNTIAAAAYDQRTGRIIVRASAPTVQQIERVTRALDEAP